MKLYSKIFIFLALYIFIIVPANLVAQEERSENFLGLGFHYGIDIPAGDLADRFGQNFHAGLSLELFKKALNGLLRLEGSLYFGANVKEDVLEGLRGSNGAILGNNNAYVDVFLRQRGSYVGLLANKILISSKTNKHSGFSVGIGAGMMQHKVRLQVDSKNAPQISGDYAKGYDRNSVGPSLKQNFAFTHIGKNKNLNYELSLYFIEAFTKNTRPLNFDTKIKDDSSRTDIFIGLDLKWIIPVKDKQVGGEIFY